MTVTPTYIAHHENVLEAFGYWPSFHDAPVLRVKQVDQQVELIVQTWEITPELDDRGCFVLTKHHEIGFRFEGVVSCRLETLGNILMSLKFTPPSATVDRGVFEVQIESVMGAEFDGHVVACSGEVTHVQAIQANAMA